MAQALGQRRSGQQRILALAQIVVVEVDRQRQHVNGQRVGEGRLEEGAAGALVDALLAVAGPRLRARRRVSQASWLVSPRTWASACDQTSDEKLSGTPAASTKLWATLMKNSKARPKRSSTRRVERKTASVEPKTGVAMADGAVAQIDAVRRRDHGVAGVGDGQGNEVIGAMFERGGRAWPARRPPAAPDPLRDAGLAPGGVVNSVGGLGDR